MVIPDLSQADIALIGFGGSTPAPVLQLVANATSRFGLQTIQPVRSQSMEYALLQAPYRTFLNNKITTANITQQQPLIIVYNLPTSLTEYLSEASQEESNYIRSSIYRSASASSTSLSNAVVVVVVTFDSKTSSFLLDHDGTTLSTAADAEEYLASCVFSQEQQQLQQSKNPSAATLSALTNLDQSAVLHLTQPALDTVVLLGNGGREHALAVALSKSPLVGKIICLPGNGGTQSEGGGKICNATTDMLSGSGGGSSGSSTPLTTMDNATVIQLVQAVQANMVVVGPEQPLVDGVVDELAKHCPSVKVFGPTMAGAQLEASKAFTKDFLQQHNIPTAKYRNFTSPDEAIAYVKSLDIPNDRQVIKASGLAAGKGVLLPTTLEETIAAVEEIMCDKAFGSAGDTCVIESFMSGPEASCLAFCDGKTAVLMPAAQDHKRALDGDMGLNTGGMGAYAPAPCVTPELHREIERMCITTVEKMAERGTPYVGILYAGMMLTPNGPSVLEFNCRFGDPETQVVLPLLETDLYEVMQACCDGTLSSIDVRFKEQISAATVVCAAKGYPETYPKGMAIHGLESAGASENVKVYHAGTKVEDDITRCSGGRVLAVTGMGSNLTEALAASYKAVKQITFEDSAGANLMHYRSDIAKGAIRKKLRIGVLGSTRGTALIPVMEACANGSLHAEIVAVVSNRSSAPILDKGKSLGVTVTTKFVSSKGLSREQFDAECTSVLVGAGVEYVLLVGYMRILSKSFTDYWSGRCINVHPSLLPKHAGGMDLAVHQAVIDANETESGCTIHEVTEDVDGGPIVVQKIVKVGAGETAESLKAKVQALEGPAFIEAIQKKCKTTVSYADAGVSIDAGNSLVELIKPSCKATRRPGCDAELGGFGGLFDLAAAGYKSEDTIIIGATDGVGTKLRVAHLTKKHQSVGIDLVAMCVNDLIVAGGEPLFFLDYFATGKLDVEEAAAVVLGIAEGCKQAGCGLIGGETAEMPSMYAPGDYDLAGFSVGAVHRDRVLPQNVSAGDVLLGLPSSGVHSNGFSLVRKLVEKANLDYDSACPWDKNAGTVGDSLLTPTKIYVKCCLPLLQKQLLNGLAHITGGGLLENLPRSLPSNVKAEITGHPPLPNVFSWMKQISGLDDHEMLRTFNCGIGMVLIVKEDCVDEVKSLLHEAGEVLVHDLGVLTDRQGNEEQVEMKHYLA